MRCIGCKSEMPFLDDPELQRQYDCMYCSQPVRPTAEEYLGNNPLSFVTEVRPDQVTLSKLVDNALYQEEIVVIEAGTGVGKSFAYLLPAVLSGKRVIVSTAKKSLQDQLLEKDLPFIKQKLIDAGNPRLFTFAPGYGKSNYACYREARKAIKKKDWPSWEAFFKYAPTWRWEEAAQAYAQYRSSGGRAKIHLPKYNSALTAEQCVGAADCKHSDECEYLAARTRMKEADVVVANHWITGFHLRLQQEKEYHLLGEAAYLIVDEAHKLDEGIRSAFTQEIRENAMTKALDSFEDYCDHIGCTDFDNLRSITGLKAAWATLFSKVKAEGRRSKTHSVKDLGSEGILAYKALLGLNRELLSKSQNFLGVGGKSLESLTSPFGGSGPRRPPRVPNEDDAAMAHSVLVKNGKVEHWFALRKLLTTVEQLMHALEDVGNKDVSDNLVTYIEQMGQYTAIRIAPIDIAPMMQKAHASLSSAVYLSATLATNGTMEVFKKRTGIHSKGKKNVVVSQFGSAFNLDKQAILYLSDKVPVPTRREGEVEDYLDTLHDEIRTLIEANQGNAFCLFTARDEMLAVYERLCHSTDLPLVVQREGDAAANVLEQYRNTDNAVLLGLKSFWEGVDVSGDKLSLVIITKLPFPGRSDPVVDARRAKAGDQWFRYVDLPDMTLDLRQGVGRLIRSKKDRGVVAILDQRLLTKRYKAQTLRSIGMRQVTTNRPAVVKALNNLVAQRNK